MHSDTVTSKVDWAERRRLKEVDLRWHGGAEDFAWIAADNSIHAMDAQTVFGLGQAAMAHKQALIFAARAIKDADPISEDYTDDIYWP